MAPRKRKGKMFSMSLTWALYERKDSVTHLFFQSTTKVSSSTSVSHYLDYLGFLGNWSVWKKGKGLNQHEFLWFLTVVTHQFSSDLFNSIELFSKAVWLSLFGRTATLFSCFLSTHWVKMWNNIFLGSYPLKNSCTKRTLQKNWLGRQVVWTRCVRVAQGKK